MKRFLKYFVVMLLSMLIFSSCSRSNDDESQSSSDKASLIGMWETSMGSSVWRYINIKADGSMEYSHSWEAFEKGNASQAHWAYNESTQSISMYNDSGYYAFTYKVTVNVDKQSWVGVDANGKTYTFVKYSPSSKSNNENNPISSSLIGK